MMERTYRVDHVNRHFLRHYVEMVIAMFVGMGVLYYPAALLLGAFGSGWDEISDAGMFLAMATTMTLPMLGWMVYRGHGPRANGEMALAMYVPTFAAIGLLWAGLGGTGVLMTLEHVAMLAAMFGVMLARPHEYSHHHQGVTAA